MTLDNLNSLISRLFFFMAFLLLACAVAEKTVNTFGYTILAGTYTAGRLLDFSVVLLIFVIALLMRQVREQLKLTR